MNYADLILQRIPRLAYGGAEPMAELPYQQEVKVKNEALREFWDMNRLGGTLMPLIEAPMPRAYRTTTKRRVSVNEQRGLSLAFGEMTEPGVCAASDLEPAAHNAIYVYFFNKLSHPAFKPFSRALNWIVIRGNYTQFYVVLNIAKLDANIVRKAKQLAEDMVKANLGITAAMLFVDPTRSDYYLEAERPVDGLDLKLLFGPRLLTLAVEDLRLKYPPTVFSQVNEAFVPKMVSIAREMLGATNKDRLLDLYCGYGLFTFTLGRACKEAFGIELAGDSIITAQETARRLNLAGRIKFKPARITAESLLNQLPPMRPDQPEIILLDPPRQGADAGVISTLALRSPRRVLQICCGTDEIVPAVREWSNHGYRIEKAQPLDLFAGTPNLETLISLVPV
jgi:tRNA/tmRNA/rRNA uracil-C5-methylase (TrmA/RlmC/RlmD family)